VKVIEVDADGNELEDVTATATASGVVPQKIYSITWSYYPLTVYLTFDTATFKLTVKAVVKVPVIGNRTLGPYIIQPPILCVTLGYPKILAVKLCISLVLRRLTLTGTILGTSVTFTLLRW